jgi:hypothetical protein
LCGQRWVFKDYVLTKVAVPAAAARRGRFQDFVVLCGKIE